MQSEQKKSISMVEGPLISTKILIIGIIIIGILVYLYYYWKPDEKFIENTIRDDMQMNFNLRSVLDQLREKQKNIVSGLSSDIP